MYEEYLSAEDDILSDEFILFATDQEVLDQIPEFFQLKKEISKIKTLKINHSHLSNLKGLQELKNVVKIDLSSNKIISMNLFFKGLKCLRYLNLSCNMLTNVNGIEVLPVLEEINLSHNKITNLEGFNLLSDNYSNSPLAVIDLRDNLISSLNQLVYLENLVNLESLILRGKDGINPICNFDNYNDYVIDNLKQLKLIDNNDIKQYYYSNDSNNYNKNMNSSSHFVYDIKYKNFLTQNKKVPIVSKLSKNNINYYKEEVKNLQNNIEELFRDQKELVYKYEKNENYWKNKVDDLTENFKFLKEQNFNITSNLDEKDFLNRELNNKITIKEQEITKMRRLLEEKENSFSDITNKLISLKKDYEFSLVDNEKLLKKYSELSKELNESISENRNLKTELTKEDNFYKDLSQKKTDELNQKIRLITLLENKMYDFTKSLNDKQKEIESLMEINNSLQINVVKYNKMKNENEFDLNVKYEKEKEDLIKKYKNQIQEIENNFQKILTKKDEDFVRDVKLLEKSYEEIINDKNSKFDLIKKENEKINLALCDCKELLKMSLNNEEKNEKIIKDLEQLNNSINVEKESSLNKFEIEKSNLMNKIKFMEIEIKELNEHNLKFDSVIRNNKNLIYEKDNEINKFYEENLKLKKENGIILTKNEEIENFKLKLNTDLNLIKIEELNENLKTKNMIIDDQTTQIIELKHSLNSKDNEINNFESKIEKVKQKYEKKIQQMKSDFEEINTHIDSQNSLISEYEETIENLKTHNDNLQEDKLNISNKLNDRDEVIKIIQNEVNSIKEYSETYKKQINEKNSEIKNLKDIIDELNKNLLSKNKENQDIIFNFENYKSDKQSEVDTLTKQNNEIQNDMLLVINEYEKQKNVIRMNIQNINNMFSGV